MSNISGAYPTGTTNRRIYLSVIYFIIAVVFFMVNHDLMGPVAMENQALITPSEWHDQVREGELSRKIGFLVLGSLGGFLVLTSRSFRSFPKDSIGWVFIFLMIWTYLSFFWSENPEITFRRLIVLGLFTLGGAGVVGEFSLNEFLRMVLFCTLSFLLVGLAVEVALGTFQPFAQGYRFGGTLQPNGQGENCAVAVLAALFLRGNSERWIERRMLFVALTGSIFFLLLTKSRTSLFALILALLVFRIARSARYSRISLVASIVALLGLAMLLGNRLVPQLQATIAMGRLDSEALSLTGRIPIWAQCISFMNGHYLGGYGYGCFWTLDEVSEIMVEQGWSVTQGHSGFVDIALDLGIVGLVLFLMTLFSGISKSVGMSRRSSNREFGFFVSFLFFFTFVAIMESIVLVPFFPSFLFLVVILYTSRNRVVVPESYRKSK